jgi:hypothetical protein
MVTKNNNAPPESALSSQDKPLENQSLAPEHKPLACAKPEAQSVGERIWHDFTYNGVNYAANLAVSLVLWDFFTAGKGKVVKNAIHQGIEKSLVSGGLEAQNAASYGEQVSEMIFSPLGGHFMMIPVKYLEDHARYFTHRINQMMDPEYKFKDIQATIKTPEEELPPLSDEPSKQKWSHIAVRRGLGWGAVVGAGVFLTRLRGGRYRQLLQGETEDFITWGMKETSKMTNTTALSNLAENNTFKRYLNLFALDAYFTVITSGVTEATKSWFSKDKNGEEKQTNDAAAPSILAAETAPIQTPLEKEVPASAPSHYMIPEHVNSNALAHHAQHHKKHHDAHAVRLAHPQLKDGFASAIEHQHQSAGDSPSLPA